MPAVMPLTSGGTAFIIDARFGEAKRPIPEPTRTKGMSSWAGVVVGPSCASIKKPIEETTRPSVARPLAPYLSDSQPLTGPNAASDRLVGIRYNPAVRGFRPMLGPCRYRTSTRVVAPLANELRNIATLAALSCLTLKRESLNIGFGAFLSISIKIARKATPNAAIKDEYARSSAPIAWKVIAARIREIPATKVTFPFMSSLLSFPIWPSSLNFKWDHNVAKMPIGTFTQKIDLHPAIAVRKPPNTSPVTLPATMVT